MYDIPSYALPMLFPLLWAGLKKWRCGFTSGSQWNHLSLYSKGQKNSCQKKETYRRRI